MVSPISIPGSVMPARSASEGTGNRSADTQSVSGPGGKREQASIRTPEDAINVLRTRLEHQLDQRLGTSPLASQGASQNRFEPPTAIDVASRVLGFVQQRLQKEAAAGADPERLSGLLSDARRGIEQGFSEAREQIDALGLMTGKLTSEIDDSFNRIAEGLAEMEARYLQGSASGSPVSGGSISAAVVEAAVEDSFAFEVTTRDGDRVTVRMDEQRYTGVAASDSRSERGESAEVSSASLFSGRYRFSVEGNLDAGEKEALADLFGKVQEVSARFFDGDIQGAFRTAQSLNLGGNELASFSLNLSATRMVSAAAYESVSREPSANSQLRPLGGLARGIRELAGESAEKGLDLPTMQGLMQQMLDDIQALREQQEGGNRTAPRSLMDDFLDSVLAAFESAGRESGTA